MSNRCVRGPPHGQVSSQGERVRDRRAATPTHFPLLFFYWSVIKAIIMNMLSVLLNIICRREGRESLLMLGGEFDDVIKSI